MRGDQIGITDAFKGMVERQGGSLNFDSTLVYPPEDISYVTSNHYPADTKIFSISIYNQAKDQKSLTLNLLINPKDVQIGQVNLVNNAYTRRGWVSTIWGRQQATITATGSSAGFYLDSNTVSNDGSEVHEGLVNYSRRNSLGFINFQTLIALFKNCGQYYLNTPSESTIFKDGRSRVVHVIDSIMISYDEIDYLGSFNTFTLDERAEMPFRLEYNFEFVISGLRGYGIEGHLRMNDNEKDPQVEFAIQGDSTTLSPTAVLMDADQAAKDYNLELYTTQETPEDLMTPQEIAEDVEFYRVQYREEFSTPPPPQGQPWKVSSVTSGTCRVTQGGDDGDTHAGNPNAIDYRPASGDIRSFTDGIVKEVYKGGNGYGAMNYVVVQSMVDGKPVLVRYFHLDPSAIPSDLSVGSTVTAGSLLGAEGTDGNKYPKHCHFEVRELTSSSGRYISNKSVPARDVFNAGTQKLKIKGYTDYKDVVYKHGKKTNP